ncbi:MAG: S-adenosyl-l-methionine hydroxide adenosyltransferase family protein [Halorhodospira sp.]
MGTGAAPATALGAVFLFTDYTLQGPYVGQLHGRILQAAACPPRTIDLMHDAPAFRPDHAAYLLAAILPHLPERATVLAVVDPGVGTERGGLAMQIDGRWLVGPDNGLLAVAAAHAQHVHAYALPPAPSGTPATFHGRDVFADVAAAVTGHGAPPPGARAVADWVGQDWPMDWDGVVYQDGFGNLISGRRAATLGPEVALTLAGRRLPRAEKYADVAPGEAFWYANSMGLVEVSVNAGSAAAALGAGPGMELRWVAG